MKASIVFVRVIASRHSSRRNRNAADDKAIHDRSPFRCPRETNTHILHQAFHSHAADLEHDVRSLRGEDIRRVRENKSVLRARECSCFIF